ncbi:MAG: hypothetical protein HF978_19705 [Desulfobacteraceae bacterium]|nr:hypothetical protein [Desulfobacteraceae bacterium]MBC2757775.1 hypothetical protein [Desulfobacteraceae bacterium]MBC2763865.1 hypothetical protein [ANME-2 cluster archaeon]
MYLLFAVIENEDLLDDLITGWMDLGIGGATVIETTGALQLITQHIPIFAGLRSLTSGGGRHNKTIFTAIQTDELLDSAVSFLENLCQKSEKPHQGVYFVTPLSHFGRLGINHTP